MTEDSFANNASRNTSPLKFFLLVFALSLPFWLAGTLTSFQLLPALPISALAFLCPVTAATIFAYREHRFGGVKKLLGRVFDFTRIKAKIWYGPIILLMPCIMVLSYGVIRLGEELGWSGYAIDPLQARFGALWGALFLGMVWAVWHVIPLLEAHRSLMFIAWWSLGTVAARVIIVWLYNNTGRSVFVAALFHAMINLTWQEFPINGSYYDPRITGVITAIVAVVVVIVWGPRTLARYSNSSTAWTAQGPNVSHP